MQENNKEIIMYLRAIALRFESQIKGVVAEKFSVGVEDLALLSEDEGGVYMSKEESGTLCCFVLGKENGFLYLVTSKVQENGDSLSDFKSDIIS